MVACGTLCLSDIPKGNNRKVSDRVIVEAIRQEDVKQEHDLQKLLKVCFVQRSTDVLGRRLEPTIVAENGRLEIDC